MAPAKLWLSIFLSGFAVCACLLLQSLLTLAPYGDLSRVGRVSEDDFGWTIEPPHIGSSLLHGTPVDKADILVIGDSFSAPHVWQSALVKEGHAVATMYWSQIDEMLCADFEEWLSQIGFRGKLVVIESVERLLNVRLAHSRRCTPLKRPLTAAVEPASPHLGAGACLRSQLGRAALFGLDDEQVYPCGDRRQGSQRLQFHDAGAASG